MGIRSACAVALLAGISQMAAAQEAGGRESAADSTDVEQLLQNLPEVMVKGERPIAKIERGLLSYNMPLLLERIPADNAFGALANIPGVTVNGEDVSFAGQSVTLIHHHEP